ncbi:hypothetical protein LOK49_LG02G02452 [Camellia lanceoleosa]|uniref:Uncharacterized protein n=1 Tax=Camellia lanceoleosa TaxID=1840588 RepID=A0ACC0II93_9ERIC|nr:hypothetical protein LOK49_LG02G02452 [Camellia lanceoleosa]
MVENLAAATNSDLTKVESKLYFGADPLYQFSNSDLHPDELISVNTTASGTRLKRRCHVQWPNMVVEVKQKREEEVRMRMEDVSMEMFKEVLKELNCERQGRNRWGAQSHSDDGIKALVEAADDG